MRRFFFLLLFASFAASCFAQPFNLQFKSVKTFQLSGTCNSTWGGTVATQSFTVDPGTVLKIESASANTMYNNNSNHWTAQNQAGLTLDYNLLIAYSYNNSSYLLQTAKAEFPIWLPAGTYTLRLFDNSNNGLTAVFNLKGFVSAIEFQLVTP
jgi:hypothetical protein